MRAPSAPASRGTCERSSMGDVLLQRPAPFKADDPALVAAGVDDEDERVVEPVVDVLAGLVRQAEAEVKAAVRQRQLADLEADASLAVPTRPAEAPKIDGMTCDERPGVVAELELQTRRRSAVRRRHRHTKRERLAREELKAIGTFLPDEHGGRDRRLAGAPFAQPGAALGGGRVVGEHPPAARDSPARGA